MPGGVAHAHAVEHVVVGNDARHRPAAAEFCQRRVPARVVGMHVRVDDPADRHVGKRPDRRHDLRRHLRKLGIDQQHAVLTHLKRDIAARAHQHVNAALNRQDMNLDVIEVLRLPEPDAAPRRLQRAG